MLVREVSEFELIRLLAEALGSPAQSEGPFRRRLSIGDDAAAWDGPEGTTVMTSDALVEGVHFDLDNTSWRDLGWKSMAVNQSDVAAMGCEPLYSQVTLGLRGDLPVEGIVDMYRGMAEAFGRYGGRIVGGDIVRSPVFFVAVAMVGAPSTEQGDRLMTRAAARPGDVVAVTGSLGCSAAGLRMLRGRLAFDSETTRHLRDAHGRPVPRVAAGDALSRAGVAAAIDVSDGLVADLGKLSEASHVGARIYSERVPADGYLRSCFPDDCLELALSGGEDYELVFAAPLWVVEAAVPGMDVPVSVIGDIVSGPPEVTVVDADGRTVPVERGGWEHFG